MNFILFIVPVALWVIEVVAIVGLVGGGGGGGGGGGVVVRRFRGVLRFPFHRFDNSPEDEQNEGVEGVGGRVEGGGGRVEGEKEFN